MKIIKKGELRNIKSRCKYCGCVVSVNKNECCRYNTGLLSDPIYWYVCPECQEKIYVNF